MINDHSQSKGDGWLKYFLYSQSEKREIAEWDQPALVRLLLTVVKITVKFLIHILSLTYVSFIE